MELARTYTFEDERFLRSVTFPEEDRQRASEAPWNGGYRWFRADNVIPIEHWRVRSSLQNNCGAGNYLPPK
jgi:hypothetical protein